MKNALSAVCLMCLTLAMLPLNVLAGTDQIDHSKEVAEVLKKKYPGTDFSSVTKAPIGDMYEVVMGRNIGYVDEKADLFLFGHIFNMSTQQDLTQARLEELNRIDFSKLPLDKAIKIVKGNGSRVFAVFTDPDCPFCHRLEETLGEMTDYTMYVLLFPIAELHPDAPSHARAIWCSKDRPKAWHEFMNGSQEAVLSAAVQEGCKTPIDELSAIGHGYGVQGTPTLVNKAGKVLPGALPAAGLEAFISAK